MNEKRNSQSRDDYAWYKEHGICVRCHHEKAEPGKTKCTYCRLRANDLKRGKPKTDKEKEQQKKAYLKRYAYRKENGICVACGKRKAKENECRCAICQAKQSDKAKKIRIKNGKLPRYMFGDGKHCALCGKDTIDGKKLCSSCLEKAMNGLKIARQSSNAKKTSTFKNAIDIYYNSRKGAQNENGT